MKSLRRYPGLTPFSTSDAALFFGRERELLEFYYLVMAEKLVVLFSKSGMGKTSLINAGLIPMLKDKAFKPVYVRLNNPSQTLKEQFLRKIGEAGILLDKSKMNRTLWEQIKSAQTPKNANAEVTLLLIFDQFEEIFTLYSPEDRTAFIREFADLANSKIPETVQSSLIRLVNENPTISNETLAELEKQPKLHIIFSIRSDLLHLLDKISPFIPDILRSRYELCPLSPESAVHAITRPAIAPGHFISPPFQYHEMAIRQIINELSKERQEEIESFQLQIICQNIEKRIAQTVEPEMAQSERIIVPDIYGGVDGIQVLLTDYYIDQIRELPQREQAIARHLIEEHLITESERRRSVDKHDLLRLGAPESLLEYLVEMRLLRKEPRLNTFYYEISHDTLVQPILVKYKERKEEEEKLIALRKADEMEALALEEARKRGEAEHARLQAEARNEGNRLLVLAMQQLNINHTLCLRLLEAALQADPNNGAAVRIQHDLLSYHKAVFYKRVFAGHEGTVYATVISPDSRYVLTAGDDKTAILWERDQNLPLRRFEEHTHPVYTAAMTPDARYVVTGSKNNVARIWEHGREQPLHVLEGHTGFVYAVAITPNSHYVVTGGIDGLVCLWQRGKKTPFQIFSGHNAPVHSVAISPDANYILSGSGDGTACLWERGRKQPVRVLKGHEFAVYAVAMTPDAKYMLTGSWDRTACLWSRDQEQPLQILRGHLEEIFSVAISSDGTSMLTGSIDKTARLWERGKELPVQVLQGHDAGVFGVSMTPDARYLLTAGADGTARMWIRGRDGRLQTFEGHKNIISSVAITPDGRYILIGSDDKTARLWERGRNQPTQTFTGHDAYVTSVAITPDGRHILTGSSDHTARLWEKGRPNYVKLFQNPNNNVPAVAFSADGQLVLMAGGRDRTAKLLSWASDSLLHEERIGNITFIGIHYDRDIQAYFIFNKFGIKDSCWNRNILSGRRWYAISQDNKYIAILSFKEHKYGALLPHDISSNIKICEIEDKNGRVCFRHIDDNNPVYPLLITEFSEKPFKNEFFNFYSDWYSIGAFMTSSDGQFLLAGLGNTLKIWDVKLKYNRPLEKQKALQSFEGHSGDITAIAATPDIKFIVTGSKDRTVRLWEFGKSYPVSIFDKHQSEIQAVGITPDGNKIITMGKGSFKLWERGSEKVIQVFDGHDNDVNAVAITPDGRFVITASMDKTIRLWEQGRAQPLQVFEGHNAQITAVAITPDGRSILSGSRDNTVRLWEPGRKEPVQIFIGHTSHVSAVAITPDGRYILSGGWDNTARFWERGREHPMQTLEGHSGYVTAVALTADARFILTGSWDRTARLWASPLLLIETMAGPLTLREKMKYDLPFEAEEAINCPIDTVKWEAIAYFEKKYKQKPDPNWIEKMKRVAHVYIALERTKNRERHQKSVWLEQIDYLITLNNDDAVLKDFYQDLKDSWFFY